MITLYDYLPSQNAWKVRQLLHHLAIPYRTEIISIFEGHGQRADYRAVNPWGAVPGIKLDDGRVLSESNAILWFLSEGTAYRPTDAFEAAKVVQWLSFEAACPDQRRQSSVLDPHWQARCSSGCYRRRQTRDRRTSVADPGRAIFRAPVHCGRRLHDRRHLHFRLCPSRQRGRSVDRGPTDFQ